MFFEITELSSNEFTINLFLKVNIRHVSDTLVVNIDRDNETWSLTQMKSKYWDEYLNLRELSPMKLIWGKNTIYKFF
jgi:hypothetical protein